MTLPIGFVAVAALGLLYSAALYAVCASAADALPQRRAVVAASLCNGPLLGAWTLGKLWAVAPGLSAFASSCWLIGLPVAGVVLLRGRGWRDLSRPEPGSGWALLALVLLVGGFAWIGLSVPLYSNDPLEYAGAAKVLLEGRNAALYPMLDAGATGGFYAPWTHPPGFPFLIAMASLVGGQDVAVATKVVASIHFALTAAAAWWLLGPSRAWIMVLALVAAPAYALGVANGYVESVRVGSFFGVVAMAAACLARPFRLAWLPMSICLALCGYAHSLGLIAGVWLLAPWLLIRAAGWGRRLAQALAVLALQLLLLAPELESNLRHFGVLLGDRPAIWAIERIERGAYFQLFRGLDSVFDRVVYGVLQGLSQPSNFGLSYWVVLAAIGFSAWTRARRGGADAAAKHWMDDPLCRLSAGVVVAYYASVLGLTALGSVEAIKNARYMLTVQPFLALLAAFAVQGMVRLPSRLAVTAALLCSLTPSLAYLLVRFPDAVAGPLDPRAAYFRYVHPESDAVRELDRLAPGSCALLFRQADSKIYGGHCFRSYLDHQLEDVYTADTAQEAARRLRAKGLDHVVTPDYPMPELYNTQVGALVADPALVYVVWARGGYRIYRLRNAPNDVKPESVPTERLASGNGARIGLAAAGEADGDAVRLCIDVTGRGRVEVYRQLVEAASTRDRILGRLQSSRSGFVSGLGVSAPRSWCVLSLADDFSKLLQWTVTDNARVTAVRAAVYRQIP